MSALTHSPGFVDFLRPLAETRGSFGSAIGTLASVASFIPGISSFARPLAAIATAFSDTSSPTNVLVSDPSQSVMSTVPQVPAMELEEEEEEEF